MTTTHARPVRIEPEGDANPPAPSTDLVPISIEQQGQATAEYALVLLGAAALAVTLTAWAARSGKIGQLFDAVIDQLIGRAG